MPTSGDQFRIAVALTALKFRPLKQSFEAYTLELCSKFPSTSLNATPAVSWRDLALRLDRDFTELREKYETQQIRLSTLEATSVAASLPPPPSSSEQSLLSKKRPKKKTGPTAPSMTDNSKSLTPLDLQSILEDVRDSLPIPAIIPPQCLFSAVDDFIQLTSLPEVNMDLLMSVTLRTLEAIAGQVKSITSSPSPGAQGDASSLERLGTILHEVLKMSLLSLAQRLPLMAENIITILDKTTSLVLVPLICAFSTRTETYLGSLFLPCPGGSTTGPPATSHQYPLDIRTKIFDLFRNLFNFLDRCLQSYLTLTRPSLLSRTFRASLIMGTLQEIDRVLSVPLITTTHRPDRGVDSKHTYLGRPERVKKLVTKDTLWYLCAVLHVLFDNSVKSLEVASQSMAVPITSEGQAELEEEGVGGRGEADVTSRSEDGRGLALLSERISDTLLALISRCTARIPPKRLQLEIEARRSTSQPSSPRSSTHCQPSVEFATGKRGNVEFQSFVDGDNGRGKSGRHIVEKGGMGDQVDVGIDVNAAGRTRDNNGSHQVSSVPQGCTHEQLRHSQDKINLDHVVYGMLLAVLERYWVWSRSWEQ